MSLPLPLLAVLMVIAVVVSAGDEVALLAFRAKVGDGGSLASWNSSAHFCSWEGVTCSHGRPARVVELSLPAMALTGALSPAVGNLTFLQKLDLSSNGLHGEIPGSLRHLRHLQHLDLSDNQLVGSIPPELGSIQSMEILGLSSNNLSGMLPLALYNLSSLKRFGVGNNMLYGSIPADIGDKLPSMQVLFLGPNQFTGTIPSSLSNLSDLMMLSLNYNGFSGYVPPTLGRLGALQDLCLTENRLEANDEEGWEFITSLANCNQLRRLILSSNPFGGQLPGSIVNLSTTLQNLRLDDTKISGSIPADIGNLAGLEVLLIVNTSMSGVRVDAASGLFGPLVARGGPDRSVPAR